MAIKVAIRVNSNGVVEALSDEPVVLEVYIDKGNGKIDDEWDSATTSLFDNVDIYHYPVEETETTKPGENISPAI